MRDFIERAMAASRKYTVLDMACFKFALVALGVLFGAYFSRFFLNYINIVWVIFLVTYIWIMYRTFAKHMN